MRGSPGKVSGQADELADFPDFLLERFAREFVSHLRFHNTGNFNSRFKLARKPPGFTSRQNSGFYFGRIPALIAG